MKPRMHGLRVLSAGGFVVGLIATGPAANASSLTPRSGTTPAATTAAPQVTSIKTTIAKGTTIGTYGAFYQSITATSTGSTSRWYVTYKPACDEGAGAKYYAGGNTFTHKFIQDNFDKCWHNGYAFAPVDSSGAVGDSRWAVGTDAPGASDDGVYSLGPGAWSHGTSTQAYGGGYVRGQSIGTQATVTTDTTWGKPEYSTGIVGSTGPSGGVATVYVDGVAKGKINFYSSTTKWRKILYVYGTAMTESSSLPRHTIKIVTTGKGSAGGSDVMLDAVVGLACCNDIGGPPQSVDGVGWGANPPANATSYVWFWSTVYCPAGTDHVRGRELNGTGWTTVINYLDADGGWESGGDTLPVLSTPWLFRFDCEDQSNNVTMQYSDFTATAGG